MRCDRRDEEGKGGVRGQPAPPKAAAILVTGSKSFQFCEASEQAEGKEEQHLCGKHVGVFRMDFSPAGKPRPPFVLFSVRAVHPV